MMNYLQVTCAICGYQAVVAFHQRTDRLNPVPAIPDVWICDLHWSEYICTAEEQYDPDEV